MNYLELAQDFHREARFSGSAPTTLANLTGQALDISSWIRESWREMQMEFDGRWRFMRRRFTFETSATDSTYAYGDVDDETLATPITRFREWRISDKHNPPTIYLTANGAGGERYLIYTRWDDFQQVFRFGTQNPNAPVYISEDQDQQLVFGPTPNDIFTVRGEYWRTPQVLSADGDIPECPPMYHMAIVYWAMGKAGYAHIAPELLQRANVEGGRLWNALVMNQSEARRQFRNARPMA